MKTLEKQELRHPRLVGRGVHSIADEVLLSSAQKQSELLVNSASCPHYVIFFMREDSIDSSLILGAFITFIIRIKFSLYFFH
ncbi:hypothetical protein RC52_25125 [Herbaspirillum rubrisubalbicans]|nr:hypothetical protein [Herbaspirillum rubrisubalbicans]